MLKILQIILKYLAKKILEKYKPEIIAITGSVGKTSAKEAVSCVSMNKFGVQRGIENYNNELGVPLAIIGAEAAGKNIFKWLAVFWRAKKLIFWRDENYPKILILELAVDKQGDMDYFLSFIKPDIGILTRVGPVHLEFFGTQEKILQEKAKLIKALPKNGFAVLNYDYKDVASLAGETKAKSITYGFDEGAAVRAKNILYGRGQVSFSLEYNGKTDAIVLLHAVGRPQIYAILAGICCGIIKGMEIAEIKQALKNYQPPKGRGNLLKGIKNTLIIDETYNASPQAVEAALENLKNLADKSRSIAVLGDMLELGPVSRDAHFDIGKKVFELSIDYLFTSGARAKEMTRGAQKSGMDKNKIYCFDKNEELGKFLQEKMEEGDVILVKGSRGMKMEDVINEIKG
ncbi:MAG: Mur ligase family protein [bacterium]